MPIVSGCFTDEGNILTCTIHYIKLILNGIFTFKYYYNIRDYTAYHPVGHLNTFLMITFYYGMLFVNISQLKDNHLCIYLIGAYPFTDFFAVILSLISIKKVVDMKNKIECNPAYKVFEKAVQYKLREVLYLPVSYESDIEEDHEE